MLGATPRCAACGNLAYHAEQVMGPARKIYHKPCLQCVNCRKRLDPGSLVEHDTEPYCKRCHSLLFGARDLRSANVFSSSANAPPVTPPRPAVSQEASPSGEPKPSPAHRTEQYSRSGLPHVSISPRRLGDPSTSQSSPLSSTWIRGEASGATGMADRGQRDEKLETGHPEEVERKQKRPLPQVPPKPAPLYSSGIASATAPSDSSPLKQADSPALPSRHTDRSEARNIDTREYSSHGSTFGSIPTGAKQQEAQFTEPPTQPPLPPPARSGESSMLSDSAQRYTSIDDAINSTTRDSLAHPSLHPSTSSQSTPSPLREPHSASSSGTNLYSSSHTVRKNPLLVSSPYRSKPIMPARASPSGNEQCVGCGKTVYFAEGVNAIGKRWHKPCLRCTSCHATVDPGRVQDRDDMPYCKNCYTREFGPTVLL